MSYDNMFFDDETYFVSGAKALGKAQYWPHGAIRGLFERPEGSGDHEADSRWIMPDLAPGDSLEMLLQMLDNVGDVHIVPGLWADRIMELSLTPEPSDDSFAVRPLNIDLADDESAT